MELDEITIRALKRLFDRDSADIAVQEIPREEWDLILSDPQYRETYLDLLGYTKHTGPRGGVYYSRFKQ